MRISKNNFCFARVKYETLNIWLLSVALVIAYLAPPEVTSVIYFLMVLIFILLKPSAIDPKTTNILKPLLGLLLLGLFYGFSNSPTDIIRDVWLVVKAVTCILLGYFLTRRVKSTQRLFKHFIFVSLLLSLIYVVPYLFGGREFDIKESGDVVSFPLVTLLALPLLLKRKNELIRFGSRYLSGLALVIILLAYGFNKKRASRSC
jgi:hypothetical protein